MAFNNYLEDENDKPYFTANSLAYYYDKMEGFAKAVEGSAKALNLTKEEVEKRLTLYIEQNKNELDQRLAQWDGKLETFDSSVETLLSEWVDDGTLANVIDTTLIDQKIQPIAAQLDATGVKIAEIPHMPKIQFSQVVARNGIKNQAGATSDLIVFKDVYHTYDVAFQTTGVLYALAEHYQNATTQGIYKSLDGGENWVKMGDLPINAAAGVWFESIFVEPFQETLYMLRANNGYNTPANNDVVTYTIWAESTEFSQIGIKNIGNKNWLSSAHSIDASPTKSFSNRVVVFGEYGADVNITNLNLWRTIDRGVTWTSVLSQTGNSGVMYSGEIRHFHTVQCDPHNLGHWWAGSGDGDPQCKIWRSVDDGLTWQLMFSGSQRERTCGFVFEKDYIYYGMDSTNRENNGNIKIVRIKRSDMSRTDVGSVDMGYAVYTLTRTYYPEGFLVWSCYENGASIRTDRIVVQFYDYLTEKLYDVSYLSTKGSTDAYTGFQGASRYQDRQSGNIFPRPTTNIQQGKYGSGNVSRYIKAKLTT